MNKFKIWKIETLWEKYFIDNNVEQNFSKIQKRLFENYNQNKKNISKFQKNFFLVKKLSFKKSEKKVFSGEDRTKNNSQENKSFFGLEKQQLFFYKNKPIYLVDNHNNALFPFLEISRIHKKKFNIVHIDAHRDDANFLKKIPKEINWENIKWCLENSRVSDYLDLAKKTKLVEKVFNITQKKEFENFYKNEEPKDFILNLDIDIFGPEGEYIDLELKIKTIAKAWKNSSAVVIATSPGYISQEDAKKIIKTFTK